MKLYSENNCGLMPNGVSDLGFQCLLTGFSIKNRIKRQIRLDTLKMPNITVEESSSIQWVNQT